MLTIWESENNMAGKKLHINIKELAERDELFTSGHRLCVGCGAGIMVRQVLLAAAKYPLVVTNATGCLEVASSIFPYSSWKTSWFHSAFENSAATISGIETAYNSLKKQGKIKQDIRFISFSGDGSSYDIGFQSLSGAVERGHRFLAICYNNEAYMNTGSQRSSATPKGAYTKTSPVGLGLPGKLQERKDLTACLVAHGIKYAAQAIVGNWPDLVRKVQIALEINGPTFINVYTPCRLGWGFEPEKIFEIAQLTLDTCFWPIYEVIDGQYTINYIPQKKQPIEKLLETQTRFKHLLDLKNKRFTKELQNQVDFKWQKLLKLAGRN